MSKHKRKTSVPPPVPPPPLVPVYSSAIKRDVKQQEKRGKDMSKLRDVITSLVRRLPLERKHNDHPSTGKWKGWRECHVEPDWLLNYRHERDALVLERTGSHSDLFE